jgi:hypothetical protein
MPTVSRAPSNNMSSRLVSYDSKFDRALKGQATLSEEEKRGFQLFVTEYDPRHGLTGADCFHCHGGALFSDFRFTNNGLDAEPGDTGRERVTGSADDKGKFAVPSLRNVAVEDRTCTMAGLRRWKRQSTITAPARNAARRSTRISPSIPTAACR